jgi:hypothetical protein
MSNNRILRRIGGKLRDESRDIVDVELPEKIRVLLERLACGDIGKAGLRRPHEWCGTKR